MKEFYEVVTYRDICVYISLYITTYKDIYRDIGKEYYEVVPAPKTHRIMDKTVCLNATAQSLLSVYHFSMMLAEANTP